MATFRIPTIFGRRIVDYTQSTIIDGREYLLRFFWNQRNGTWYMDLRDQDESPIVTGLPLVLGASLVKYVTDSRLFNGALIAIDLTGLHAQPNIDELGDRVRLYFIEA